MDCCGAPWPLGKLSLVHQFTFTLNAQENNLWCGVSWLRVIQYNAIAWYDWFWMEGWYLQDKGQVKRCTINVWENTDSFTHSLQDKISCFIKTSYWTYKLLVYRFYWLKGYSTKSVVFFCHTVSRHDSGNCPVSGWWHDNNRCIRTIMFFAT